MRDIGLLRVGDMLEFAGTDEPAADHRPCGDGAYAGREEIPSSADTEAAAHPINMVSYCSAQRQNTKTSTKQEQGPGVRPARYLLDDAVPEEPGSPAGRKGRSLAVLPRGYRPMCP